MISVTRLNGSQLWLNALLIEMVEETPDTYITLINGKRMIVLESANEIITSVKAYHHEVGIHQATIKVRIGGTFMKKMLPWLITILLSITLIVLAIFLLSDKSLGDNGKVRLQPMRLYPSFLPMRSWR